MSDTTLATISRPEAFRLIGDNLEATPEMITACGYTPVGQELRPKQSYGLLYIRLAKYLGPFFFLVDAAHTQARSILRVRGIDTSDHIGGGFAAGAMVTARYLDKSLKAMFMPSAIDEFGIPTIESARETMHRSLDTLQPFTQTSNSLNGNLESIYGIKSTSLTVFEDHLGQYQASFSQERDDSGKSHIIADDWQASCMRATYSKDPEAANEILFNNNHGCPARKIFLPKFYHWAVDFSCNTADIVQAEIERHLADQSSTS